MPTLHPEQLNRFCADVSGLVKAGVPLPEGLKQLEKIFDEKVLKELARATGEATAQGQQLSEALRKSSTKVPEEYIALVECGEKTGELATVLQFANRHSRMVRQHRSRIALAALYPAFIVSTAVILLSILATFVIPPMSSLYVSMGAELPYVTQQIITLLSPLTGIAGLGFSVFIAIALIALICSPAAWPILHRIVILFSLSRETQVLSDCAIAMRFLSVMLRNGVPEATAVRSARLTVMDPDFAEALAGMADSAEKGLPIHQHLPGIIPATAVYAFRAGEERGTLPDVCEHISDLCLENFEHRSRRLVVLLEPALVLIVGIMMGTMVVAFYLPLFSIPKLVR